MTATQASTDEAVFEPRGRPVRRFVVAIVVACAVLIAIWWAGLFAPRIGVLVTSAQIATDARPGTATIDLNNRGRVAVRVAVELLPTRYVKPVGPAGPSHTSIGGRTTRTVAVHYLIDCAAFLRDANTPRAVPSPDLRIVVKADLGGWSTTTGEPLNGACGQRRPDQPG
jgi:hypothetical protein